LFYFAPSRRLESAEGDLGLETASRSDAEQKMKDDRRNFLAFMRGLPLRVTAEEAAWMRNTTFRD
jgi:hypothetical protein